MPISALARANSALATAPWKNIHLRYIRPNCSQSPALVRAKASRAVPIPYQAGIIARLWVQAKTQGMARRLASEAAWLRRAGREPIGKSSIAAIGVAWRKYSTNPSAATSSRYAR